MRTYSQGEKTFYSFDTMEECLKIRKRLIKEGIYSIIDPEWKAWTIKVQHY